MFGKKRREKIKKPWTRKRIVVTTICVFLVAGIGALGLCTAFNVGPGIKISRMIGLRAPYAMSKHVPGAKIWKSEKVYVDTKPDGTPYSVVVDARLKNNPELKSIVDQTRLSNLYNIDGDEVPQDNGNGTVTWPTPAGQDIFYEGVSDTRDLPISVDVKYWLNGKPIKGEDLKGKTGKVKIEARFKNNVKTDIKGKKYHVPFVCMTSMIVTDNSFKKMKISGGKVLTSGSMKVGVSYAVPGLSKVLGGTILKDGVGDKVTVTGVANEFGGNELIILVSNDILKVVNNGVINKLNADKKINRLDKATKRIEKGSKRLAKGVSLLNKSVPKLAKGTKQAADGSEKLSKKMSESLNAMKKGAKQLTESTEIIWLAGKEETKKLRELRADEGEDAGEDAGSLDQAATNNKVVGDYIRDQDVKLAGLQKYLEETDSGLSDDQKAKIKEIIGAAGVPEEVKTAEDNLTTNIDYASKTVDEIKLLHNGAKTDEEREIFEKYVPEKYRDQLTNGDGSYMGLDELMEKTNCGAAELHEALSQATGEGDKSLTAGARELAKGMRQLENGTVRLQKGVKRLNKGSNKLAKGMTKYYNKAIGKIVKMYNKNLKGVAKDLKTLKKAGAEYNNYSGITKDMNGSVTFMYFIPMGDF